MNVLGGCQTGWERKIEVPAYWLQRRAGGAVDNGLEFEELLKRSFIPVRDAGLVDISMAQLFLLTTNIVSLLDDETHGFGRSRFAHGHTTILATCLLERTTLEQAIERTERYFALSGSGIRAKAVATRRTVSISVSVETRKDIDAALLEDSWATFLVMLFSWFTGEKIPVIDMTVRAPDHPAIGKRHLILECPVALGNVTTIRMPAYVLGFPRRAERSENLHRDVLDHFMHAGRNEDMASASRSFRNARIVDLVTARLQGSTEPLDDIAMSFGYSDARSLRRLIKSKTGKTPQEIRATKLSTGTICAGDPQLQARAQAGLRELLSKAPF